MDLTDIREDEWAMWPSGKRPEELEAVVMGTYQKSPHIIGLILRIETGSQKGKYITSP